MRWMARHIPASARSITRCRASRSVSATTRKRQEYLRKALQINPDGIDPNYFYAEFLYDEDDYAGALQHLEKALKAAPRPGRASADEGRRQDIQKLMAKVRKELTS
jgi:tetratricopeptide (TPR) repeat protein